ncbi:beta-glucosidase BglX [Saccharicrinis fermentans]|uniref:beta-glucosidase n=1 Tax=Saccharicrinis fermentans DSM 9555 = JCM 21142 TaxID=869213 RepID=W7YP78_9BACT|nr:beta-glucosidase BglX [Saccharicrinis fermentans]GAF04199.1 periplasmic beta-glucosidase precursor [Saccharicrinis fermentans DSM 9555 = JCM 21142]
MTKKSVLGFAILAIFLLHACSLSEKQSGKMNDSIDKKVDDLLAKMTIEEKVGQMVQYNGFYDATGPAPTGGNAEKKYKHLKSGLVGSFLNVKGVDQVRALQKVAVEETRLGIPLIFGLDVIHGHKTLTPIPLGESASWDLKAIEKSARIAAIEASANGINWTFAPMVDIYRDARWGRVMEGAGEDPYLGAKIGVARIKGFQGDDLSASNTIAACAKHFAAYGFVEAGKDYNTVDIGTTTLYNVVFPPFKAAVEADVKTVMNAFNIVNEVPATGNKFLQRDILKEKWGFKGFVVSDWGSAFEMISHGFAADLKEAAMLAANSGSDMDMESSAYVDYLVELVKEGKVKEAVVDEAAGRILRLKYELGLFEDPYKYCDASREKELLYHDDHQAAALDMARKSIVLLKNEGAILPLSKNQKKIAVIGALANDKTSPLGSWRVGSDDGTAISVLEGLNKYTSNYSYVKGADVVTGDVSFVTELNINNTDKSGFAEAIRLAKKSEVVLMVLGEHGFHSGEGRSRANIDLPGVQQDLLEAVYEVNKNIVLVLTNGRPLALPWAADHIPAIVEAWQLGTQAGNAIADVLFGAYNPSGKLPMSFPRSVGQCPIYYNKFNTGRPSGSENSVFWSHYTDEKNSPLFPFGYGLSYSEFTYSDLAIDDADPKAMKVSVKVTNVSDRDGEEVVQLYLHDVTAAVVRPVKELKGFEKITLKAKESKTVTFLLTENELGFYDGEGNFMVEPGWFDVMVGTSSLNGLKGSFELK